MPWSQLIPSKHTPASPMSTQTTRLHTAGIQREVIKATHAPLTLTSSWEGHSSSPHPQGSLMLNEHVKRTQGIKCHGWTLCPSLNTVVLSPPFVYSWASHLWLHSANEPCSHANSYPISRQTEDQQHHSRPGESFFGEFDPQNCSFQVG